MLHFTGHVINLSMLEIQLTHVSKGGPWTEFYCGSFHFYTSGMKHFKAETKWLLFYWLCLPVKLGAKLTKFVFVAKKHAMPIIHNFYQNATQTLHIKPINHRQPKCQSSLRDQLMSWLDHKSMQHWLTFTTINSSLYFKRQYEVIYNSTQIKVW